jgi:hypothetical protein
MEEVIFTFVNGKNSTYQLKEPELEQKHKDLLLGGLIRAWEHNTSENRNRFTQMLLDNYKKDAVTSFFEKINQQQDIDPEIQEIVNKNFDELIDPVLKPVCSLFIQTESLTSQTICLNCGHEKFMHQ